MTILLDIFPALGHYNACFGIAKKLKAAGHRVVFCVDHASEETIQNKGFETLLTCSRFIDTDIFEFRNKGLLFVIECFISVFTQSRKFRFAKHVFEFENTVKEVNPDIVILDTQISLKIMAYHHIGIPVLFVETMPLSLYDPWIPPFTSDMVPKNSFFSKLQIQYQWNILLSKRKLNLFLKKNFFFGQNYYTLHQKLASKFKFSFRDRVDLKRSYVTGFKGVDILSMTPSCFDFPRKYKTNTYFATSRIDDKREDVCSKRYLQVMNNVTLLRQDRPDMRLVYCSFGTVSSGTGNRYNIFFKKMKMLCERYLGYIFIMSVGTQYEITNFLPIPNNIFIFQRVPQLDILSRCDIMITHGGMNSIAECIRHEVPMLVFPLSLHWDQPGNAARVEYHGLGLKGCIENDSVRLMDIKLNRIIREYAFFKQNLTVMKEKMFSDNGELPSWWELFLL